MQVRILFAQIDFKQMYLDQLNRHQKEKEQQRAQDKALIDSGVVSALDLEAPTKAVEEFNRATSLMKEQHSKEAIKHLQRAIVLYPKFVSAHNGLGLAYLDQEDMHHARSEFEAAVGLDPNFPGSFLNLGLVAFVHERFCNCRTATGESCFPVPQRCQDPLQSGTLKTEPMNTSMRWKRRSEFMRSTIKGWPMCTTSPRLPPCPSRILKPWSAS
jgi:tetratricopeptide (TPR) repeat protein